MLSLRSLVVAAMAASAAAFTELKYEGTMPVPTAEQLKYQGEICAFALRPSPFHRCGIVLLQLAGALFNAPSDFSCAGCCLQPP
eukprot:SAG22_NODE_1_length_62449_cov_158.689270_38_plen_84_part_00